MCADMMISHLYFYKYNKYPLDDQKSAFEKVYDNVSEMKSYVYGIALTDEEKEMVISEAKEILDVEDVVASILLLEDLRIQKN